MDHKNNLEGQQPKVYFDVQKPKALLVQPLNQYNTLAKEIDASIKNQISIYINELKELEVGKDPKHALAMVVFEEGGTKEEKKKRGRRTKNVLIGSISVSFDLPPFCYKSDIDIERIFATCPPKKDNSEKEVLVTPLEDRKFSMRERTINWRIELSKRSDNRTYDVYSTHLLSNKKFRSKPEVVNFILYEAPANINYSKKRKSDELATKYDAMICSTSKVPNKEIKTCSTRRKTTYKIPQVTKTEININEWFSQEKKNDTDGVAKPDEKKKEYLEILKDIRMHLSRLMIHEIEEFIDAPIDLNF